MSDCTCKFDAEFQKLNQDEQHEVLMIASKELRKNYCLGMTPKQVRTLDNMAKRTATDSVKNKREQHK